MQPLDIKLCDDVLNSSIIFLPSRRRGRAVGVLINPIVADGIEIGSQVGLEDIGELEVELLVDCPKRNRGIGNEIVVVDFNKVTGRDELLG